MNCEEKCDCPACRLEDVMREVLALGVPPELMVPLTIGVLQEVISDYGVGVIVNSEEVSVH